MQSSQLTNIKVVSFYHRHIIVFFTFISYCSEYLISQHFLTYGTIKVMFSVNESFNGGIASTYHYD